jgi:hypothetical protein
MEVCFDRMRVAVPASQPLHPNVCMTTWTLRGQSQPVLQVSPHHKFLLDNGSAFWALYCRPFVELQH